MLLVTYKYLSNRKPKNDSLNDSKDNTVRLHKNTLLLIL